MRMTGTSDNAMKTINQIGRPRSWAPWIIALAAAVVLAVLPLSWNNLYYQNLIILAMILAIMASSWNVMGGFAGYISLGHGAFLGVGAYTTAVTATSLGWPMWAGLAASLVSSVLLAAVMGAVSSRTRGIAF